jgi:hypothetical protein
MVGARRSWKMADFPRAAIGRTIFLSVPRAPTVTSVCRSCSFAYLFIIFFFLVRFARFISQYFFQLLGVIDFTTTLANGT